jgi:hypothetical protein
MATWEAFASAAPDLAGFGLERLRQGVAYLATVRGDGSPRVHPVTPIIGGGRLLLFMEPTSPKGADLRRDPRYALHSLVTDQAGSAGEFIVRGSATPVTDPSVRQAATAAAGYTPRDRYVLFELGVDGALSTIYTDGRPIRRRWGDA